VPELPDLTVYVEALDRHIGGAVLERIRIASPSLLRSVDPPIAEAQGRTVTAVRRIAKRIAIELDGELHLVFHLMIAGRFRWKKKGTKVARKGGHAAFDFGPSTAGVEGGSLMLTEASTKKRASLYLVRGEAGLREHDPGGREVFACDLAGFREGLAVGNHTLKRALTDPHLFAGIGNAYSDEILHRARLSPVKLTHSLVDEESERLFIAVRTVLTEWTERLRAQNGAGFPDKVTAFRPEMAAHGRYGEPCPDCGAPIQRIRYADNETNYCAPCQTGGKLLADRALSRLLKKDWPRSLEEMEQRRAGRSDRPAG
jgi:formamidopyrimidine-DNA glycosylase